MATHPVALALILASGAVPVPPPSQAPELVVRSATGRALQGNVNGAISLLAQVQAPQLNEKDRAHRACMLERFRPGGALPVAAVTGVTAEILRLYRAYWHTSLLQPESTAAHEKMLAIGMRGLLRLAPETGWEAIEAAAKKRLAAEGYNALMGRTPPFLEFLLWRSQHSGVQEVALPEGRHPVRVSILDDFSSLGWSAYATCDRSFTGGWVKSDGIFAVRPGWKDMNAENFKVSFLAHETQHFADKKRFGELASWELEYRAKLAELALADTTLARILSAFMANQGDRPSVPHSFANQLILSRLTGHLKITDPEDLLRMPRETIRRAARALLRRDSGSRRPPRTSAQRT